MGCVSAKQAGNAHKKADKALKIDIARQDDDIVVEDVTDGSQRGSNASTSDILYKGYSATNPKKVPDVPMSPNSARRRHAVVYEMFDLLDINSDGMINIHEFHEWVKPARGRMYSQAEKTVQRDKNAFLLFQIDTNHDAEIGHDELEKFCDRFTVREVEALVRDIRSRQDKQKVMRSPKRSPMRTGFVPEMGASGHGGGKVYNGNGSNGSAESAPAFSLGASASSATPAAEASAASPAAASPAPSANTSRSQRNGCPGSVEDVDGGVGLANVSVDLTA